ncbi:unnamed protein product [Heligmosomoides polygyrus]|uniref:Uncharacterized protein n=1 Tax=Heligmosomoides polygyrus TaxID=6339 RepID=A0A183GF83_HELPZ|nr:unnamed protein product [Heligmosomoides polygyrus]
MRELEDMGLWDRSIRDSTHVELRGDDSLTCFGRVHDAALFLTAFAASDRPMTLIKQEAWSAGCEYLRNKVTGTGCYGYLMRSLGTCLSNPLENESRHDISARLKALHAQFATLLRRGADCGGTLTLWMVVKHYWGCYKRWDPSGGYEGEPQRLPEGWLTGDEGDGGLGLVFHPTSRQR